MSDELRNRRFAKRGMVEVNSPFSPEDNVHCPTDPNCQCSVCVPRTEMPADSPTPGGKGKL